MNQKRILVAIAVAGSVFAAWGAKISAERLALGHYRVFGGLTSNPRRPAAFKHGGIQVIHADGGGTWQDTSDEVSFPKGCRHGTAFAVQKQQVESLILHSESESVKGLKL